MHRREFVTGAVAGVAAGALTTARAAPPSPMPASAPTPDPRPRNGRLKQSVCRWCYASIPLDDFARDAAAMGLRSVELLTPDEWPVIQKHGLICAVGAGVSSNPIPRGLNRPEHHDAIAADILPRLEQCAAAQVPCQIVFSGNRAGLSDADGLRHCARGLKLLTPAAERLGVTLVMELLNSRVDHADYQCDHTAWGADLVQAVGSPRFKLLYDIYHMQIMEGDVIRTIRTHHESIAHYHTAGNPGRNEIDESQELNYPAICRAILDTGFTGYLAQEFIPRGSPLPALKDAVERCDV